MSLLYAGGLWTVFLITALGCGYIWALNGPRWGYRVLLILAALVIITSQFLDGSHAFRISVAQGLHWWKWAVLIAFPVLIYAMVIRSIKRKVNAQNDP